MTLRSLLFITSIWLAWASPAPAAGCQYDMQCKGERICQMGQCVSPDAEEAAEAAPKPPAARATPTPTSATAPRLCCTVAGKLKLAPGTDNGLAAGEACQGMTSSGKPVPGSIC